MPYAAVNDNDTLFDRQITFRDAYRIMERFVSSHLSRGETPVSDFLYVYAGDVVSDQSADPSTLYDFLTAARRVLDSQ